MSEEGQELRRKLDEIDGWFSEMRPVQVDALNAVSRCLEEGNQIEALLDRLSTALKFQEDRNLIESRLDELGLLTNDEVIERFKKEVLDVMDLIPESEGDLYDARIESAQAFLKAHPGKESRAGLKKDRKEDFLQDMALMNLTACRDKLGLDQGPEDYFDLSR